MILLESCNEKARMVVRDNDSLKIASIHDHSGTEVITVTVGGYALELSVRRVFIQFEHRYVMEYSKMVVLERLKVILNVDQVNSLFVILDNYKDHMKYELSELLKCKVSDIGRELTELGIEKKQVYEPKQ